MPLDLYGFQLCASLEGLSNVRSLIIPLGQSTGLALVLSSLKAEVILMVRWKSGRMPFMGLKEWEAYKSYTSGSGMVTLNRPSWSNAHGENTREMRSSSSDITSFLICLGPWMWLVLPFT